jgi:glutaminyl-tRNA synthetase
VPPMSFQFMRTGYFTVDSKRSEPGKPVWIRSVALKESYKVN